MKNTILVMSFGLASLMLTGCAAQQTTVMSGVSTQSREVATYNVAPQQTQLGRYIPYTYIGQPNVVHYLDRETVQKTPSYNVPTYSPPVQQARYNQNNNYNNGNGYQNNNTNVSYNNGYTNNSNNSNGYSNSNSYDSNNVVPNQNSGVLNLIVNKFLPNQNKNTAQNQNYNQNQNQSGYVNVASNNNYNNSNNGYATANAGVSYVAPTTNAPGMGYEWKYNPRNGWGWYNPQSGWYQGWQ